MALMLFCVVMLCVVQTLNCEGEPLKENSRLNFFDIDLLRYTTENKVGNVIVSPASMKSLLAMILEGARGKTEDEIKSALRLSPNKEEYREQLSLYLSMLKKNKTGTRLHNSNMVFVSDKLKVKREYDVIVRKLYNSEVRCRDLSDPVAVADLLNSWTSTNTNGNIQHIIDVADISPSLDMVFINALFYKGAWVHAFDPRQTRKECFYTKGNCTEVAMMSLSSELNYAYVENLRAHAVELPYEGKHYSMILLVPQDRDGLSSVIRDLPYTSLPQISHLLQPNDVSLSMPKFNVDYTENMVGALKSMRINTLFTKDADLSGMYEGGSPTVNSILHSVHLTVDEHGTVAAAATSAIVIPLIGNGVQLRVDRPFLFFIRDNDLGLVLFEGKIEDPMLFLAGKIKPEALRPAKRNRPRHPFY